MVMFPFFSYGLRVLVTSSLQVLHLADGSDAGINLFIPLHSDHILN
jgi:hypothetical protein